MVTLECAWCGKAFKCWPGKAKKRKYCSRACLGESQKNRVTVKCAGCGEDYWVPYSRASSKFCSRDCHNRALLKEKVRKRIKQSKQFAPPRKVEKFTPIPELTASQLKRLWGMVDKSPGIGPRGDCWEIVGCGRINIGGKQLSVRRIIFMLANGPIPGSVHVISNCGNTYCANPDHLVMGQYCWDGIAKLTEEKAEEIRQRYFAGKCTYRQLGREYGVSRTTIYFIINDMQWEKRRKR